MKLHLKQAWDTAKMLRNGLSHHHRKPQTDKLRSKDGNLSQNDKEFTEIFGDHFKTVFSREDITFDPTVLDSIKNRPTLIELDDKPTFDELLKILQKASNHKASGKNDVPMDALKVLSFDVSHLDANKPHARPIIFILEMLESIWEGGPIPEEWRFSTLCPIYKLKGETTDPNNWRPVCLLDVTYKILAAIIAARMNPHIRNDGMEEQCG